MVFKPSAEREFRNLPPPVQLRLARELSGLAETPRPAGCKKLQARPGYRLRVGDYRIIFAIEDGARRIQILAVGHRRDIYQ